MLLRGTRLCSSRPIQLPSAMSVSRQVLVPGRASSLREHLGKISQASLHQSEVLQILMRAEEKLSSVKLHEDASHRPNIGELVPAHGQDHLRTSVLSRVDDGGMVLIFIRGIAEVNQLNVCTNRSQIRVTTLRLVLLLPGIFTREAGPLWRRVGRQQNVLRLQIGMSHL
eukprot:Skav206780  [mRNA]  locus=scaffold1075:156471:164907:- [translate_table: standard]